MLQSDVTRRRRFASRCRRKPLWGQTTIDRLWVTTQREAMIEAGPPPVETPAESNPPVRKATAPPSKTAPSKAK